MSNQTCTKTEYYADPWSIGINTTDDTSNNIALVVYVLMLAVVAVVAQIAVTQHEKAVAYYHKFTKLSPLKYLASAKPYKEAVLFNSDILSMIVSFLPSNDLQRLSLTCRIFGVREEGGLSLILHDEALLRRTPPSLLEDCQICRIRMPTLQLGHFYMACCGKQYMCSGCFYASFHDNQGNIVVDNLKCPFCRAPYPNDDELIERSKKREEAGDAEAIYNLGCYYRYGRYGFPQDYTKAFELLHRAAELGYATAYFNIGCAHDYGEGVEVDKKKATYYYELAAMRGNAPARNNLGVIEYKRGNVNRALKHYTIAAEDGISQSLTNIKQLYKSGQATKDVYTKALELYQMYLDEIKSDQRDEAAAAYEDQRFRYY